MLIEDDYSNSYKDTDCLLPIIQGLAVHFDWHINKIKMGVSTIEMDDLDVEYLLLNIADIEKEIQALLYKKLLQTQTLSKEKLKDLGKLEDDSD